MPNVKEYSVEEKLNSLIRLQKIDSNLDEINVMKGELPIEVSDLEDEIQGLHSRKNRIEEEINGISVFISQKKETIEDAELKIKKYTKQSDNVKNKREFEAINKEIEGQHLEMKLAEKHIKDATEDLEERALKLETENENIVSKEELLVNKKTELEKIMASSQKDEKKFLKQSKEAESHVDNHLLMSYNKIRKSYRNGLAVVSVVRDSCGGCFNAIPPQKQSEIRQRKKIMVCENCGRILIDMDLYEAVDV